MTEEKKEQLLRLLEADPRITPEELAVMMNEEETVIKDTISQLEKEGVICGYKTMINWEKCEDDSITAMIELKVTPQMGEGYEKIAEEIYLYPQVESLYLMSGAYDFLVTVRGKTVKEVSMFVNQKLASIHEVQSTTTHFMLTRYKEMGVKLASVKKDERMVITL